MWRRWQSNGGVQTRVDYSNLVGVWSPYPTLSRNSSRPRSGRLQWDPAKFKCTLPESVHASALTLGYHQDTSFSFVLFNYLQLSSNTVNLENTIMCRAYLQLGFWGGCFYCWGGGGTYKIQSKTAFDCIV